MGFGDLGELVGFLQGKKLLSSLKAKLRACSAGVCQDTAVLSHGGDDAYRGHHRSSVSARRDCGGACRGVGCSKAHARTCSEWDHRGHGWDTVQGTQGCLRGGNAAVEQDCERLCGDTVTANCTRDTAVVMSVGTQLRQGSWGHSHAEVCTRDTATLMPLGTQQQQGSCEGYRHRDARRDEITVGCMRGTAMARGPHSDRCQVSPPPEDTQPSSPSSRRAHLGVPLVVVLLGADPAAHQVVAHRVGQREVIIAGGGDVAVLDEGEVEVAIEALAHLGHVAQPRDAPHADLLPTLPIAQRCRHPAGSAPPALPLPPRLPGPGPGQGRGRRACASSARHKAGPAPLPGRAEGRGRAAGDRPGLGL